MNTHFQDAIDSMKRAGETAKEEITEEIESMQQRVSDLIDREESDPEQGRFDEVRQELEELQQKAEGETREAIQNARERLENYRDERNA